MLGLRSIFDNFESEGTVFGSISKTNFEQIKIVAPPIKIVKFFQKMVTPMEKRIGDW